MGREFVVGAICLRFVVGLSARRGLHRLQRSAEIQAVERVAAGRQARDTISAFQAQRIVDAWSAASVLPSIDSAAIGALCLTPAIVVTGGPLTLLVIGGLLAFAIPSYIRTGSLAVAAGEEYAQRRERLENETIHLVRSLWEIRGVGGSSFAFRRLAALSERESEAEEKAVRQTIGSSLVTEFVGGVAVGLVAMVVGFRVLNGGSLTLALIAIFLTIEMSAAVRAWSSSFHTRQSYREAVASPPSTAVSSLEEMAPAMTVHVDELVTYAPAQPVSFSVRQGETVLLRGPSGIGKSTVLRVLTGDLEPRGGSAQCSATRIGYVDPQPVFVEGSLTDNVLIAKEAQFEEFLGHCAALRISRDLSPATNVQRGGSNFSHGERIKLAVARALVNGAELLILDDVASFLDHDSRRALGEALKRSGITIIEATNDEPICSPDDVVTLREVMP